MPKTTLKARVANALDYEVTFAPCEDHSLITKGCDWCFAYAAAHETAEHIKGILLGTMTQAIGPTLYIQIGE